MLRDTLKHTVEAAVAALVSEGRIPAAVADVPVEISDTKSPEHGDYACNLAMSAAKRAGMNPRQLGEMLREALVGQTGDLIKEVDVAGPGFLNLKLNPEAIAAWVTKILETENFGSVENESPERINVEFVSVNPNGPITIGSGRGAAFGSALCNVLTAAGNVVHREYYINDGVNSEQMRQFSESVRELANNRPVPEKGYRGEYVEQVGKEVADGFGARDGSGAPFFAGYWSTLDQALAEVAEGSQWWPNAIWWAFYVIQIQGSARIDAGLSKNHEFFHLQVNASSTSSKGQGWEGIEVTEDLLRDLVDRIDLLGKRLSPSSPDLGVEIIPEASHLVIRVTGALELSQFWFRVASQELMVERQRGDLSAFGVFFDTWFSEQTLHDEGIVASRIDGLKATGVADEEPVRTKLKLGRGGVIEETIVEPQTAETPEDEDDEPNSETQNLKPKTENTLWLRSTKFGDDMDRVLRRRDGRLTYIASDVSYHENKLTRPENATKMITILGPDHHGYIGRLTAVVAALLRGPEDTPEANARALAEAREKLEVIIYQLVRFLKDGKPAPMRKRDGNIYELRDLIDELGKNLVPDGTKEEQQTTGRDVARFFYLMRSHDTTMDFDIDLATQQSDENPVFYAQYAHARICSVLRKAEEGESKIQNPKSKIEFGLLTHPRESALIKKILDLPWEVERVARDYGVHRLTTYAVELARTYHHFYDACRVIQPDQPELTQARLALCEATKKGLKATFDLLGVSSPERLERRVAAE